MVHEMLEESITAAAPPVPPKVVDLAQGRKSRETPFRQTGGCVMDVCPDPAARAACWTSNDGAGYHPARSSTLPRPRTARHSWTPPYSRSADSSPRRREQDTSSSSGSHFDPVQLLPVEPALSCRSAQSSRAASPERPSSSVAKTSVPKLSRTVSQRTSALPTIMEQHGAYNPADSPRSRPRGVNIRRWDPKARVVTPWDDLRRDPDLWLANGTCLVHLYSKGHSKRGPSFKVPLGPIHAAGFAAIFDHFFAQVTVVPAQAPASGSDDVGWTGPTEPVVPSRKMYELFISPPEDLSKGAAYSWHVTTRNFFAFIFGKPLVGSQLGKTLVELQERIHLFRPGDPENQQSLLKYLETAGYLSFGHCPDHALGLLNFAEHYQLQNLWTDAFAHCVGMNDDLSMSPEFEPTSRITKALITRAYLEMDLHLARATRAINSFLEDDLSASHLGLSIGARAHIDRFRSFLHSFYVEKFGYWPPPRTKTFPKALYKSMYFDFRDLYDFLVDLDSTDSLRNQRPASGGICVLQNVQAFDRRHKYIPLPHPLPLLPEAASEVQPQKPLLSLKLGTKHAKMERHMLIRTALAMATNTSNTAITGSPLVREYQRFEKDWSRSHEEKVSITDARKVRWLLVYGCLQMLISITRAPKEVRDTEGPSYPLCCLVAGELPWEAGTKALNGNHVATVNDSKEDPPPTKLEFDSNGNPVLTSVPSTPTFSIHPDCENDDYFNHTYASDGTLARNLPQKLEASAPLRTASTSGMFRNASFKSLKSISKPSRRNSAPSKPSSANYCEILVQGYGNGLNEAVIQRPSRSIDTESIDISTMPEITVAHSSPPGSTQKMLREPVGLLPVPAGQKGRQLTVSSAPALMAVTQSSAEAPRTPVLEALDIHKVYDPRLPRADSYREYPSDISTISLPLTGPWTSRSASPSSASSRSRNHSTDALNKLTTGLDRSASLASSASKYSVATTALSPTTPLDELPPPLDLAIASSKDVVGLAERTVAIRRSVSVESFFINMEKDSGLLTALSASNVTLAAYPSEIMETAFPAQAPPPKSLQRHRPIVIPAEAFTDCEQAESTAKNVARQEARRRIRNSLKRTLNAAREKTERRRSLRLGGKAVGV